VHKTYSQLEREIKGLIPDEGDGRSLLRRDSPEDLHMQILQRVMDHLRDSLDYIHWVGIYFQKGDSLILGPFSGPLTDHTMIRVGQGVCGTAVALGKDQIVDDVSSVDNYLACNLETKSELVMLIRDEDDNILGQIDVDSSKKAAFGSQEKAFFRRVATHLSRTVRKCPGS
jgi:L-methionine (R)-S-oxide reductase